MLMPDGKKCNQVAFIGRRSARWLIDELSATFKRAYEKKHREKEEKPKEGVSAGKSW
jgi:hypothetical protein